MNAALEPIARALAQLAAWFERRAWVADYSSAERTYWGAHE